MRTVVNDFSIHVATVNGSGSQTANNVLLRAIFQMGIPVSGKNLFPSNIAGLPTWFTIRASKDGWIARRGGHEILVVMNPETAATDVAEMGPGTVIVANDGIKLPPVPDDRFVYTVPMAKLMEPITNDVKLRRLVVNMIYVGVLAELLGIEKAEVERALDAQLGKKPKALAKVAKFERYRDVDGDGIPYRTLPGAKDWKGTYFTRGSGHDEAARYTEDPNAYVRNMDRLKRKLETARTLIPVPEVFTTNGAEVGLIAYGSSHWAVIEARAELAAAGTRTSYMRVRGLPLAASVAEFVRQHDRVYVIEQNRDGQLAERIRLETPDRATRVRSVLHYDGLPLDARSVTRGVLAHESVAQGVVK